MGRKCDECGNEMVFTVGFGLVKIKNKDKLVKAMFPFWYCENCDVYMASETIKPRIFDGTPEILGEE